MNSTNSVIARLTAENSSLFMVVRAFMTMYSTTYAAATLPAKHCVRAWAVLIRCGGAVRS